MTLNEYQKAAKLTAIYPGQGEFGGINYCVLKLNGEAGEVAELVGKTLRGDYKHLSNTVKGIPYIQFLNELGDVLWYISNLADEMGFDLDVVAEANLNKLKSRTERGVIQGSGSDR